MITSRAELKDYCLRALGSPVISIEVADEQVEDRIDDAIQFFQEHHYDGTEKMYMKYQLLGSTITVTGNITPVNVGDTFTGQTSGASFVVSSVSGQAITCRVIAGTLVIGETIKSQANVTATVVSYMIGDIQNQWIHIPDRVVGIVRVLPFKNNMNSAYYAFDPKYQLVVSEVYNLMHSDMIYYTQVMQHIDLIDFQLRPIQSIRFNRRANRCFLDFNWNLLAPGDYIIFETFTALDPDEFGKMFSDHMLKKYATALIKRQWGANTKKFEGVQMIGGITISGQRIFDEASEEIERIEADIRSAYEEPPIGFLG